MLVRRQVRPADGKTVRELAFYGCAAPATTPLTELIRVSGVRSAIEECFQTAKNEADLGQYHVCTWRAWYANITRAMLVTPTSPPPAPANISAIMPSQQTG